MEDFGELLAVLGLVLPLVGAMFLLLGRTSIPFGCLPGDIFYRGKNTSFDFPLTQFAVEGARK